MTPGNPGISGRTDSATGALCARGNYCPTNSNTQFSCGSGTFCPYEMAFETADCLSCQHGRYCPSSGLYDLTLTTWNAATVDFDCDAGYYCQAGSDNAKQNACDYDEICITGSVYPIQCPPEQWTANQRQSSCDTCTAGLRCLGGSSTNCAIGTYCSSNTINYCPNGYYGTAAQGEGQST